MCIERTALRGSRITPDGNGWLDVSFVRVQSVVRGSSPFPAEAPPLQLAHSLVALGPDGVEREADLVDSDLTAAPGPPGLRTVGDRLVFAPPDLSTTPPGDHALVVRAELRRDGRVVASDAVDAGVVSAVELPGETDLLRERREILAAIGRRDPNDFSTLAEASPLLRAWEADPGLRARLAEIGQELRGRTIDDLFDEQVTAVVEDPDAEPPTSDQIEGWRDLFTSSGGLAGVAWRPNGLPIGVYEPNLGPSAGDPEDVARAAISAVEPALRQILGAEASDTLELRAVRDEPRYGFVVVEFGRLRGGFEVPSHAVAVTLVRIGEDGTFGAIFTPVAFTFSWEHLGFVGQPAITYEDAVRIAERAAPGRASRPPLPPGPPGDEPFVLLDRRFGETRLAYAVDVTYERFVIDAETGEVVVHLPAAQDQGTQIEFHPYGSTGSGADTADRRPFAFGFLWDDDLAPLDTGLYEDLPEPDSRLDGGGRGPALLAPATRMAGRYVYQSRSRDLEVDENGERDGDVEGRALAPIFFGFVAHELLADLAHPLLLLPEEQFRTRERVLAEWYLPVTSSFLDADETGWSFPRPRHSDEPEFPDWFDTPRDPWPVAIGVADELPDAITCEEDADCQLCDPRPDDEAADPPRFCASTGNSSDSCTNDAQCLLALGRCIDIDPMGQMPVLRCDYDRDRDCDSPADCPLYRCDHAYDPPRCRGPHPRGFNCFSEKGGPFLQCTREKLFGSIGMNLHFDDSAGINLAVACHEGMHRLYALNNLDAFDCWNELLCRAVQEGMADAWEAYCDGLGSTSAGATRPHLGTQRFDGDLASGIEADDPDDDFVCACLCDVPDATRFGECIDHRVAVDGTIVCDPECDRSGTGPLSPHRSGTWFAQTLVDLMLTAGSERASRTMSCALVEYGFHEDLRVFALHRDSLYWRLVYGQFLTATTAWDVWRALDRHVGDAVGPVVPIDDVPDFEASATPRQPGVRVDAAGRRVVGEEVEVDLGDTAGDRELFSFLAVPGEQYVVETLDEDGLVTTDAMLLVLEDGSWTEASGHEGREAVVFEVDEPQTVFVSVESEEPNFFAPILDAFDVDLREPILPATLFVGLVGDDVPDDLRGGVPLALGERSPVAYVEAGGDVDSWLLDVPADVTTLTIELEGGDDGVDRDHPLEARVFAGVVPIRTVMEGRSLRTDLRGDQTYAIVVNCPGGDAGVSCGRAGSYSLQVLRHDGSPGCEETSGGESFCVLAPSEGSRVRRIEMPFVCKPDAAGARSCALLADPFSRASFPVCMAEGRHMTFEARSERPVTLRLFGQRGMDTVELTSATGGGLSDSGPSPTLLPFAAPNGQDDLAAGNCYRLDVEVLGGGVVELRTSPNEHVGAGFRDRVFDEAYRFGDLVR